VWVDREKRPTELQVRAGVIIRWVGIAQPRAPWPLSSKV
jgi:hypothetical protein